MQPSPLNLLSVFIFFFTPSISTAFSPARNVTLFEDAFWSSPQRNSFSLTKHKNCTAPPPQPPQFGVGRAFYSNPVRFLDHSTNATASFSCRFSFTVTKPHSCPSGDGIAFLVASTAAASTLQNGHMGLPAEFLPQDSYFAVEFDTNENHVSISADAGSNAKISVKDGRDITSWIEYRHSDTMIRVWIAYSNHIRPKNPVLVSKIDLSKRFKPFMSVGFTASNVRGSSIYTVNRWRFKTFLGIVPSTMGMDGVKTVHCSVCSQWDTNIEFGSFNNHRMRSEILILIVVLASFAALTVLFGAGVVACLCVVRQRGCRRAQNQRQPYRFHGGRMVPMMLSLSEIRLATNGFNHDRVIGEGGSAVVYAGKIPHCGTVAIKRFNHESHRYDSSSLSRVPFNTEFATMAGCLRHKNLVQLQGWCCERNELVLVYEYMANGSLDKFLHGRVSCSRLLTWEKRLNIIHGVASALIYLHEECESQIIHRDVKTCNILLDAEFNPKLGDFGLAEVYRHSFRGGDGGRATFPAGTMGYLAPEYAFSGVPTVKTDVYSFGVVVLEVATGRRPVDQGGCLLPDHVWGMWERGGIADAADPKLGGRFSWGEMERVLVVGLACAHPNGEMRPTMREAARMLSGEVPLPVLPTKRPIAVIQSVLPQAAEEMVVSGDETPWSTPRTHFSKNQYHPDNA